MSAPSDPKPRAVRHSRGARPRFYADSGLDHAMSMILVLASELCVLRDRVDGLERVGKQHGIDFAAELDQLTLDQPALDAREQRRQAFLDRLYYLARKEATELAGDETDARYREVIDSIGKGTE